MAKPIHIAAVGDITLSQKISEDLDRNLWDSADVRIGNLESPLVGKFGPPADKQFRLHQRVEAGEWLKDLNPTAVSIANNHTMDWGSEGLYQTQKELDRIGVKHSGGGRDIDEAIQPALLNVGNHRIAFLSWATTLAPGFQAMKTRPGIAGVRVKSSYELEPSLDLEQPGTAPWIKSLPFEEDLSLLDKVIEKAYQEVDFVILALHWGVPPQWCTPYQGLIAEYQPILAQRAAKAGADLILGHHAHAPYGMESFIGKHEKEVPVFYSLGNYISHYEYSKVGLDVSSSTIQFPPSLPENRQTSIADIKLLPAKGRLEIEMVKVQPAILSDIGEAIVTNKEKSFEIANRLHEFTNLRGTSTVIEENNLVWKNTRK
ncbi:CapA family protein [Virgibacillus byunsanensis]|uniref:CapA family protein n=1 Tax=Virgibacillus byunsanensis TaxID=570945 RepID=A0ABW3LIU5_9BACI